MSFSDGSIPHGTRHVDIFPATAPAGNGQPSSYAGAVKKGTYVLEGFSPERSSRVVRQYNEVSTPSGAFATDDFTTASCVAQVFDVTKPIKKYDAFTIQQDGATTESYWVTSAGTPEQQGEYRKQNINLQVLVSIAGPPVTV